MKLGIISDIHEDVESLKKALGMLEKNSCDEIICLGDIVGVCIHFEKYMSTRNAKKCVSLVRQNCKYIVAGNHDLYAARKIPEYRGGFNFPDNWYRLDIGERRELSEGKVWLYEDEIPNNLEPDDIEYLSSLKEFIIIGDNNKHYFFSHFIIPNITGTEIGVPQSRVNVNEHVDYLKKLKCSTGMCGHIHAEGMILFQEQKNNVLLRIQQTNKLFSFGNYCLGNELQCVSVPVVADIGIRNGVAIFDTNKSEISCIPIN